MGGCGWIWVDLGGSGWIWVDLGGSGWIWVDLGGCGWLWAAVGGGGRGLGVPGTSPVQASVLMAEALVRSNLSHSKRAYPTPSDLSRIEGLQIRYE